MPSSKPRVLIVEDEVIVGLDIAAALEVEGYQPDGPYKLPDQAVSAFNQDAPDVGILDVNLGLGVTSAAVAERFQAAGTPFIFLTGYDAPGEGTMDEFPGVTRLPKPVDLGRLVKTLNALLERVPSS